MKTHATALSASLLLGSLLVGTSSAHRTDNDPVTVTRDDTTFEIARYRHGRSSVSFEDDDYVMSEYVYNKAGYVATISAGHEEYKVVYDSHGDVEDVRRLNHGARALRGQGNGQRNGQDTRQDTHQDIHQDNHQDILQDTILDADQKIGQDIGQGNYAGRVLKDSGMMGRRRARSCEDCEAAWDTVCGEGLEALCKLEEAYGSVFGSLSAASLDTMCSTFLSACKHTSADDVCRRRCDRDDDYESGDDDSESGDDDSSDDGGHRESDDDDDDDSDDDGHDDDKNGGNDDTGCDICGTNAECIGDACECREGYQGDPLVSCADPCDPNPCLNGGSCSLDLGGGHICSCVSGYGGMACATETSGLLGFYIEVVFLGLETDWTEGRKAVFTEAADRWEEVVINQRCTVETAFPGRLLISATLGYIDGLNGTLAQAGPDSVLHACEMTSMEGSMKFDPMDVEKMENSGNFDSVVLHEMGHVIGIGTLWENCSTCFDDQDPEWKCPLTVSVYNDLLGNPGGTAADIVELEGGAGTACAHFSEEIFGDELCSGNIDTLHVQEEGHTLSELLDKPWSRDIQDVYSPLSKITAAALDDTGYVVNATVVDDYTLPSRRPNDTATAIVADNKSHYVMKSIASESTVKLIGSDGEVVGEKPGVMISLYGGYAD